MSTTHKPPNDFRLELESFVGHWLCRNATERLHPDHGKHVEFACPGCCEVAGTLVEERLWEALQRLAETAYSEGQHYTPRPQAIATAFYSMFGYWDRVEADRRTIEKALGGEDDAGAD